MSQQTCYTIRCQRSTHNQKGDKYCTCFFSREFHRPVLSPRCGKFVTKSNRRSPINKNTKPRRSMVERASKPTALEAHKYQPRIQPNIILMEQLPPAPKGCLFVVCWLLLLLCCYFFYLFSHPVLLFIFP